MNSIISNTELFYLNTELGLSYSSIHLGIKLSIRNNTSLPLALWSYSLITNEELDEFYDFLWS